VDFKALIKEKFCGTSSPADFYRHLESIRLLPGQAPLDIFMAIEAAVYQGKREHPDSVGDPKELARRTFLQSLPGWLRELLSLCEDVPLKVVVIKARNIWICRAGKVPCIEGTWRPAVVAAATTTPSPATYCAYHRSKTFKDAGPANQQIIYIRTVPFAKASLIQPHVKSLADQPQVKGQVLNMTMIRNQNLTGRPVITMDVGGSLVKAFIDTGSSATLMKYSLCSKVSFMSKARPARRLLGVTGTLLSTAEERDVKFVLSPCLSCIHRVIIVENVQFPGEVLLGIDFLRRFSFKFVYRHPPAKSCITLQSVQFPVSYTDSPSLQLQTVTHVNAPLPNMKTLFRESVEHSVHVCRTVVCPPRSGNFVNVSVSKSIPDKTIILFHADPDGVNSLMIPRSLVCISGNRANVWVVNPSRSSIKFKNGKKPGSAEIISCHSGTQVFLTPVSSTTSTELSIPISFSLSHLAQSQRTNRKYFEQTYQFVYG